MRVSVEKIVGKNLASRTEGRKMRLYLLDLWDKHEKIEIDFEGMEVASVSFIDEAFAALLEHHTLEEMVAKLKFTGMDKNDKDLLNTIILARRRELKKLGA